MACFIVLSVVCVYCWDFCDALHWSFWWFWSFVWLCSGVRVLWALTVCMIMSCSGRHASHLSFQGSFLSSFNCGAEINRIFNLACVICCETFLNCFHYSLFVFKLVNFSLQRDDLSSKFLIHNFFSLVVLLKPMMVH